MRTHTRCTTQALTQPATCSGGTTGGHSGPCSSPTKDGGLKTEERGPGAESSRPTSAGTAPSRWSGKRAAPHHLLPLPVKMHALALPAAACKGAGIPMTSLT